MNTEDKRAIALWRMGVLGPLISARLEHGDRRAYFLQSAARCHQQPDGRTVRLSVRTIESWFYDYQHGGFDALLPQSRSDQQKSRSIRPEVVPWLLRAKREKPRRSIRRIIRMLERASIVRIGELSRSSVHRLFKVHGVSSLPVRGPSAERRSFLHEHAGDLWVGDAMHGPLVLAPDGTFRKAYLLSVIDGATRYLPHSQFMLSEGAVTHEAMFKQTLLKCGRPRLYYVDNGPAYIASSLRSICLELGIQPPLHTEANDAEAKGVIERWHKTWRAEVGDELPPEPLTLADLNAKHWAWLSVEYHGRKHSTTERVPREHWLSEAHQLRPLPRNKNLEDVFLHRVTRTVRKDGTVRFGGGWLEVRPELSGKVQLRFDPSDPQASPRVFVDDRFVCDTVPLDRYKNATRKRRRNLGMPEPQIEPTGLDPLALMQDEHTRRASPLTAYALDPSDSEDTEE